MCGIAGFWWPGVIRETAVAVTSRMAAAIAHRGPDDEGIWIDPASGVGLAHRRLSIVDLSPAGHQPMASASGRYQIAYNGEIYNYPALRAELEERGAAPNWRGHSDTEVLLACLDYWGLEDTLPRLAGMFAIALWDQQEQRLILARDRAGEKPLYYGRSGNCLLFGSELKALKAHPAFEAAIERSALPLLLRHNYIPAPWSIWHGIHKLEPAHYVVIEANGARIGKPQCYWNFEKIALAGVTSPKADGPELVEQLDLLLRDAVGRMMVADVPLGAFLSGGIDSSTIVALMQAQSRRPVRTFSIGFEEAEFDESPHARSIANHLGTDHTELTVTARDALAVVPKLPHIWDEPFSDSSQIPTYLLSALTRQHVTVSLSGDGGDELFGGYTRYFTAYRLWRNSRRLPPFARRWIAAIANSPATGKALDTISPMLPRGWQHKGLRDRLPKVAQLMEMTSPDALYRRLVSHFDDPQAVIRDAHEPATALSYSEPVFDDFRNRMMYLDTISYLPDDILAKVDRASMAVALESRVPFLDHHIIEFAWSLPLSAKFGDAGGKRILRDVLARYVPRALFDRPKMGFGVPLESWLRGPLRDWAEAMLEPRRLREEGFFAPDAVRTLWEQHLSHGRNHYLLWDILMFQSWYEINS